MEQAGQAALFGFALCLKCALIGAGIGAAMAAVQIFPGRWHPAWAHNLLYWFSSPLFAGLAGGVLLALKVIPAMAKGRLLWLLLCLLIASFTAILAAGALAYLTRNHDPGATSKTRRMTRRHTGARRSHAAEWQNRVRSLFRPSQAIQRTEETNTIFAVKDAAAPIRGQKATLPPPRFPSGPQVPKPPHYAGHPRKISLGRSKPDTSAP